MKTIRCDFTEDPIVKAIESFLEARAVLIFTDRASLVRAQKIVQKKRPFSPLRLMTMEELKRQCRKSLNPVLRRDLRNFVLYGVLTDEDKSALNISSYRTAQTFTKKFFQIMEEWQEYRLPLEIDWDDLYETRLTTDTALWQRQTWHRLLAIRQAYSERLKQMNLTDPIFLSALHKPFELRDYRHAVVVNPFQLTPFEKEILALFDERTALQQADAGWMRDDEFCADRIGFDTLQEEIPVNVRVIKRTDAISLNLALSECLEEHDALVVDNQSDPFYLLFDPKILSMDIRSSVSLEPAVQFLSILRDILSQLEYREDDPVPLFPAHVLVRAMDCEMFRSRYFTENFREEFLARIKKDKLRSLPLDLEGLKPEFQSDIRTLRNVRDLSGFITGLSFIIADFSSDRMLRILLDTASTMRRIDIDLKGVQLLDAFLVTVESRKIHDRRDGGRSRLLRLDETDNLAPGRDILFMNIQEGTFPAKRGTDYLFTDRQRKTLGLPDSEARRRHDFFRFIALCLSGGKITLLYRTDRDANLHVSSFAEALTMVRDAKSDDTFSFKGDYAGYVRGLFQPKRTDTDPVEPLRIPLQPFLTNERLPLSFSGLQTLIKDSAAYCLLHLVRLEPLEISEERGLDNLIFGNMVHEVMQNLFIEFNRLIRDDKVNRSGVPIEEHRLGAMIDRQFDWIMRDKKKFYYKIPCGYSRKYFDKILLPYLRASVIDFVEQFMGLVSPLSIRQFRFHAECGKPVASMYHNPPLELTYDNAGVTLDLSGRIDLLAHETSSNRFWIFDFKTGSSRNFEGGLPKYQTRFYERILFSDEQGAPSGHGSYESRYYFVMDSLLQSFDAKTSWSDLKEMIAGAFEPVVLNDCFTPSEKRTGRNDPYLQLYGLRGVK